MESRVLKIFQKMMLMKNSYLKMIEDKGLNALGVN